MEQLTVKVDLNLLTIIYDLVGDLEEPSIHYLVHARYFLYHDQKSNFAPLHFNMSCVDNIEILDDGIRCKFSLGPEFDDEKFVVKILFRHISKVSKYQNPSFQDGEVLFMI